MTFDDFAKQYAAKLAYVDGHVLWTPRGQTIVVNGRSVSVHRLTYSLEHGDPGPAIVVSRVCGSTKCVKPEHLAAVPRVGPRRALGRAWSPLAWRQPDQVQRLLDEVARSGGSMHIVSDGLIWFQKPTTASPALRRAVTQSKPEIIRLLKGRKAQSLPDGRDSEATA